MKPGGKKMNGVVFDIASATDGHKIPYDSGDFTVEAVRGVPTIAQAAAFAPSDIAVIRLPRKDAMTTVQRIRTAGNAGILIFTRCGIEDFMNAGADDFADDLELVGRAIARLAKRMQVSDNCVRSKRGGVILDPGLCTLTVKGVNGTLTLPVTQVQRAMLASIIANGDTPATRKRLLDAARLEGFKCPSEKNVDSQITLVRQAFAKYDIDLPIKNRIGAGFLASE